MKLAKLDGYNYLMLPGVIRITIDGVKDPDLVDIMSEIQRADNNIYVEGRYYRYLDEYHINTTGNTQPYLELQVEEL